jgi:hypothetical protein
MSTIGTRTDNETKNDVRVIDFEQRNFNPNRLTSTTPGGNSFPNQITVQFPFPQSFSRCEAALTDLYLFYSWFNISAEFGNNTFSYSVPTGTSTYATFQVTIPDGFYSIDQLSDYFQTVQIQQGNYVTSTADPTDTPITFLSWASNSVYYRTTFSINPFPASSDATFTYPANYAGGLGPTAAPTSARDPVLIIPPSNSPAGSNTPGGYSFSKTLGITPGTYPPLGTTTPYFIDGQYPPVIESTNNVNVALNLINNGALSQNPTVIYKFSPQVSFGEQIALQVFFPVFLPVVDGFYQYATITFLDENYIPLNIQDPHITGRIIVRGR